VGKSPPFISVSNLNNTNMKRVGEHFNNVSDKLKKELIKPLGNGHVANFRLLNGELELGTGRTVFGSSRSIPTSDRIWDPYHREVGKDEAGQPVYEGDWVDIGVPEIVKNNVVERCKKHVVNATVTGIPGNGFFSFVGGNANDTEVYECFCLSNRNVHNKYRDKSQEAWYEMIDPVREAKDDDKVSDLYEKAVMRARSMSAEDISVFWNSLGRDIRETPEIKKSWVRKYAREHPADFIEKTNDESLLKKRDDIRYALTVGVIKYDVSGHKIVDGNTGRTIAVLDRAEGKTEIELFEEWLRTVKNGDDQWKQIQKQVKNKTRQNTESAIN
jgi:hypothetical protein